MIAVILKAPRLIDRLAGSRNRTGPGRRQTSRVAATLESMRLKWDVPEEPDGRSPSRGGGRTKGQSALINVIKTSISSVFCRSAQFYKKNRPKTTAEVGPRPQTRRPIIRVCPWIYGMLSRSRQGGRGARPFLGAGALSPLTASNEMMKRRFILSLTASTAQQKRGGALANIREGR